MRSTKRKPQRATEARATTGTKGHAWHAINGQEAYTCALCAVTLPAAAVHLIGSRRQMTLLMALDAIMEMPCHGGRKDATAPLSQS